MSQKGIDNKALHSLRRDIYALEEQTQWKSWNHLLEENKLDSTWMNLMWQTSSKRK